MVPVLVDPLPAGWALLLGEKTLTETPLTEDVATHGAHQLTTYTKNLEMENFINNCAYLGF